MSGPVGVTLTVIFGFTVSEYGIWTKLLGRLWDVMVIAPWYGVALAVSGNGALGETITNRVCGVCVRLVGATASHEVLDDAVKFTWFSESELLRLIPNELCTAPCWTVCTPKPGGILMFSSGEVLISIVTGIFKTWELPPAPGVNTTRLEQVPGSIPAVCTPTVSNPGVVADGDVADNQFAGQVVVAALGGTETVNSTGWPVLPIWISCAAGASFVVW